MIENYLSSRRALKGVVVIMDIRRIPRQEEHDLIDWLKYFSIDGILVLTKTDKLSKQKRLKQHIAIAEALTVDPTKLILFSAKSRQGRDAVWNAIISLTELK
jgi:GTP-binding protein